MLVDSMSYNITAINEVNKGLMDAELRERLDFAGNTIMDVGLEVYKNTNFKNREILQMLGLDAKEAYLFSDLLVSSGQVFAATVKKLIGSIYLLSGTWINVDKNLDGTTTPKKSHGGIVQGNKISFPSNSVTSTPSFTGGNSVSGDKLQNLLMSFSTNKFGSGIISTSGGKTTNIIVSGEIKNYVNNKYTGVISGEKILTVFEKQLA
jgi:hypothetical protein